MGAANTSDTNNNGQKVNDSEPIQLIGSWRMPYAFRIIAHRRHAGMVHGVRRIRARFAWIWEMIFSWAGCVCV